MGSQCKFACNTGFNGCPTGAPAACVDEQNDATNCGSCGNTCPGPTKGSGTPACKTGACSLNCGGGLTACPSTGVPTQCDDLTTDLSNCGSCGNACTTAIAHAHPTCGTSQCGFACDTSYELCNGNSCIPGPDPTAAFASPGGSGSACSAAAPCALATALGSGKPLIYLDQGSYGSLSLPGGANVTLQGGWSNLGGGNWTTCNVSSTAAQFGPVSAAVAGTWTLTNVSVSNSSAVAGSVYAVFATAGNLTLNGVSVATGPASDGSPGTPPAITYAPDGGTTGCTSGGSTGTAGGNGGAGSGSYGTTGYAPGTAQPGNSGQDGLFGGAGGAGVSGGCAQCKWNSGDISCDCFKGAQGTAGLGGCPGTGGAGGNPGTGGGSSVGIFAAGATVTINGGNISTQNGGRGGDGAVGQKGGIGAAGVPGQAVTGYSCVGTSMATCKEFTPTVTDDGGAPGPTGGNGGGGGIGGGGKGGDSYCWYAGPGASISASSVSCSAGSPGAGGNASNGGTPAASGSSGHVP